MKKHTNRQRNMKLEQVLVDVAKEADRRIKAVQEEVKTLESIVEARDQELKTISSELVVAREDADFWHKEYAALQVEHQRIHLMSFWGKVKFIFEK